MAIKVLNAEFIKGATRVDGFPESDLPEIAFIGRSNAGKSTLLNRLTSRKKLAKVSGTPGKTQEFNFFDVKIKEDQNSYDIKIADLPGYGYAKFAKTKRAYLTKLIWDYIEFRENLKIVCILSDIRRDLKPEEAEIRDFIFNSGKVALLVLTKGDKLSKNKRAKQVKIHADAFGLQKEDIIVTGDKIPLDTLLERISLLCQH